MTENIEAIVLGHTKFGENSVVVHTLSEAYGRRGFLVHVGKKAGMTLLLPMNILEMDVVPNPKSTLWSARNLVAKDPLNGIRGNLYKNTMSLFLSEVLLRTVKDGQTEDGLFPWCVRSILTLDGLDTDFANFHVRFLLELAGALGFSPSFDDIAPFAEKHLSHLRPFLTSSFSESMLIPLKGEDRNALCEDLLRYLEYHTESSIQVRSLAVLREVFG
ncbi:MAG: DNA repair protein RecO C-terminal domain-containing protein [Bacteroidales bacterium]|jgi:DNA repair protein RecO (recombination protein O)|nr:DNA repair protein RecO C-terminal domain-containing protein [Bacteroidales bacterium]